MTFGKTEAVKGKVNLVKGFYYLVRTLEVGCGDTSKMAEGGEGTSQGSMDEKGANLWSLFPTFDPSVDNAKEYADKVRFLWGICPSKDRPMLAPRLALLCKGTAWSQVKNLDSAKHTDSETGYKTL